MDVIYDFHVLFFYAVNFICLKYVVCVGLRISLTDVYSGKVVPRKVVPVVISLKSIHAVVCDYGIFMYTVYAVLMGFLCTRRKTCQ